MLGHPEYLQAPIVIDILVWNSFRKIDGTVQKKAILSYIVLGCNLKVEEKEGSTGVIGSSIQQPANEHGNIIL
jgi:hypothetical protein